MHTISHHSHQDKGLQYGIATAIISVLLCLLSFESLCAQDTKTLLIINSYNENEPWVTDIIQPLMLNVATNPDVHCEIYDLNNAMISGDAEFENLTQEIISIYATQPPSYVVMVGNLAFNMRQAIKSNWGDVPMLLVTTIKDFASKQDYFSSSNDIYDKNTNRHLSNERGDYNMTAIIIPEYYKQTVDMMVELMPKMNTLVFMSDTIYVNRKIAHEIQHYLKEEYPEIHFSWLKASAKNAPIFHNYLIEPTSNKGLLLSTWLYAKHDLASWKIPTTSDLKLIAASHNPIFSLHEAYISLGVVGGVYPSLKLTQERVIEVMDAMLAGKSMRDIDFYVCEDSYPCINYRLLKKYGLSESNCPEGTVFYSRPQTFWDKYMWQAISLIILVVMILIILWGKNLEQRKKIIALKRNSEFVDNMPLPYSTAAIRYDSDGNVLTIAYKVKNAAFDQLVKDNAVTDSPYMLFPAKFIGPKVAQLLKDHKTQTFVYHFDRTDTYYEFILCVVNSQVNVKDKNVQSIDVFAIDITRRQKTEIKLDRAMRALDRTIDIAKLLPWQYNINRNTILYDYHKGDAGAWIGDGGMDELSFEDFVDTQVYEEDRDTLRRIRDDIRAGKVQNINLRIRKISADDSSGYNWFELVGAVTALDDERQERILLGSSQNITERVRTQHDMAVALERANESDRMKSSFLASMSHEIRTPLNAIVGFSNVIAHTDSEEERLEFCDIINKNNQQLLALINDVLDLAKIESNTIDINYAMCDINALIEQVEKSMSMKVPNGLKFKGLKGANQCVAEIDEIRVVQILDNMISNSCKFTSSGSITFGYDITNTGMLYFYVRDTGIGISKEDQEKVFDRFFKTNVFVPGTGLGLSICRNLIEKMGGEIGVESSGEGKGSMFWFSIPYVPGEGSDYDGFDRGDEYFHKMMTHLPVRTGRSRIKVLIAEDNESNYRLLAHLLHDRFDIVHAVNGHEAVRLFMREEPDVVLMDISMPGMDGYNALKEIRKFSSSVPVIAVTAYVYASDRQKILAFGFDGYVSKPVTQKGIVDAIGRALLK